MTTITGVDEMSIIYFQNNLNKISLSIIYRCYIFLQDLSKQLLPLVCESLVNVLILGGSFTPNLPTGVTSSLLAGEEDIRSAACVALLAVSHDLVGGIGAFMPPNGLPDGCTFVEWLANQVWELLETSNELSPATGPLLVLASRLLKSSSEET